MNERPPLLRIHANVDLVFTGSATLLCGRRLMRIQGDNAWVELARLEVDDQAFDVQCSVGDFAGRNGQVWIDDNEHRRFIEALRSLERDRRGEASLRAISPQEFELMVRVV